MAGIAGGRLGGPGPIAADDPRSAYSRSSILGLPDWASQQNCSLLDYLGDISTSVPEWDRQFRLARIHHEHREELGRLSLAGIGADAVAVAGQLREALSGLVGRHRFIVDLTADLPLNHGRIDEGGFGMRVTRRVAARAVFDEHALDALARNVRQLVLVDEVLTLAFFDFCASASTLPNGRVATSSEQRMRFMEPQPAGCVSDSVTPQPQH